MTDTAPTAEAPAASEDVLGTTLRDLLPHLPPEGRVFIEIGCQQMRAVRLQAEIERERQHILALSSALLAAGIDPVTLQPTASKPEPGPEDDGAEVAKDKSAAT